MVTPLQLLVASVSMTVAISGVLMTVLMAAIRASSQGLEARLGGRLDTLDARLSGRIDGVDRRRTT